MRQKILATILATLIFAFSIPTEYIEQIQQNAHNVYEDASVLHVKYRAWLDACLLTRYSCQGLKPPTVRVVRLKRGLYGAYDGRDYIWISDQIHGNLRRSVIMHEMIHYIQVKRGGLLVPGPAKQICEAEAEAFTVVDRWAKAHGLDWLIRGPNWWRPYKHCYKWYAK